MSEQLMLNMKGTVINSCDVCEQDLKEHTGRNHQCPQGTTTFEGGKVIKTCEVWVPERRKFVQIVHQTEYEDTDEDTPIGWGSESRTLEMTWNAILMAHEDVDVARDYFENVAYYIYHHADSSESWEMEIEDLKNVDLDDGGETFYWSTR